MGETSKLQAGWIRCGIFLGILLVCSEARAEPSGIVGSEGGNGTTKTAIEAAYKDCVQQFETDAREAPGAFTDDELKESIASCATLRDKCIKDSGGYACEKFLEEYGETDD